MLLESWSLDTIGNAAFARLFHAELRAWRRIHIITSDFHLARTEAIFRCAMIRIERGTFAPRLSRTLPLV